MLHRIFRPALLVLLLSFCCTLGVRAQGSYEERAKAILQMFETGDRDSSYVLIEALKADRNARYVPIVLFTRAQMTPDDRALDLYRELIALEPGGAWADDAVYQLVRRYVDKHDSLGAYTWANVLRVNYPRSPFIPQADDALKMVTDWTTEMAPTTSPATAGTPRAKPTGDSMKAAPAKPKATVTSAKEKGKDSGSVGKMKGYALQVVIFPTKSAAETRYHELEKKKLRVYTLPKFVDGKKQYALIVGPYPTIDEANAKKAEVAASCECKAFVVKVE
jgi:cell division septation protein DedD